MYAVCKHCGRVMHIRIEIPESEWRRRHAPDTPPSEPPKITCYFCWKEGIGEFPKED